MFQTTSGKIVRLHKVNGAAEPSANLKAPQAGSPKPFPSVTTAPRLLPRIPDEILDYFGWVFCQGGFLNLHMTFEQFLSVVAAVSPAALCPEYDL